MKKLLVLTLALLLAFSFVSCGSKDNDDEKGSDNTKQNNSNSGENENGSDDEPAEDEMITYFDSILSVDDDSFKTIEKNKNLISERNFSDINEEIEYLLEDNALVSYTSNDKAYTLYVDKLTAQMYYVNNITGEIISSNGSGREITVFYRFTDNKNDNKELYSENAVLWGNVSVKETENGISVSYKLDNQPINFLLPERISAAKFEEKLLKPMLLQFAELMKPYAENFEFVETNAYKGKTIKNVHNIFESSYHNPPEGASVSDEVLKRRAVYYKGTINLWAVQMYMEAMAEVIDTTFNAEKANFGSTEYKAIRTLFEDLLTIYVAGNNGYFLRNINIYEEGSAYYENYKKRYYSIADSEISKTLEPIYEFMGKDFFGIRSEVMRIIAKYLPEYTKEEMISDEEYCGIYHSDEKKVEFECTIEYTLDENGNLCVVFKDDRKEEDKAKYFVDDILLLRYLEGNYVSDSLRFATDGSKTVISFREE